MLEGILELLWNNREWLFSGVGVSIVVLVWFVLSKLVKNSLSLKNKKKIRTDKIKIVEENVDTIDEVDQIDKEKINDNNEVYKLAKKFIRVYEEHGINKNQIPAFVDKKFNTTK